MYKYTYTTFEQLPPSLGGNWEAGETTHAWFSKSPKKACAMEGAYSIRHTGATGVPIMSVDRLERDGKLIWERWD
jgi:hypothetical protein